MLLPKSSRVFIPCFKSVSPRVCLVKVQFLAFFGPDMKTEMGVVIYMYLNYSPDNFDSKCLWVYVVWWDPAHVTPRVKLYMHIKV